jgi:hypothetical protein
MFGTQYARLGFQHGWLDELDLDLSVGTKQPHSTR